MPGGELGVRIFKTRWFDKFAKKERISDADLREAIRRAEDGLIDADYGGGVIKQRIARRNAGKSGGYRSVILYRHSEKAFFIYGFSKNQRDNMDEDEEREFKRLAKIAFALSDEQLSTLIEKKAYKEVKNDDENQDI